MTNYEKIKNMSVEEMAKILYKSEPMMDRICNEFFGTEKGCKEDVEQINQNQCKKCVRNWLESEVRE